MKDISAKGWALLIICALCPGITFGLLITGFPFWVGPWMADFHVSRSQVMTGYSLGALVMILSTPLVGRALDFLSVRAAVTIGALVMAVGLALATAAQAYWQVLVLFATLVPVGTALAGALPTQTLAVRIYPHHAGLMTGIINMGLALGGVLVATCASVLVVGFGWRTAFLVGVAVLAAVVAPLAWFALNAPHGQPVVAPAKDPDASTAPPLEAQVHPLRTGMFWVIIGAVLPMMFALASLTPNLVDVAKDFGLGIAAAATLVGVMQVTAAIGGLAGGWISDRLQHWLVFASVVTVGTLSLVCLTLRPDMALTTAALGVFGFCGGIIGPWSASVIAKWFGPAAFARVMGLVTVFFVPATLVPILVAWIRDTTGSYLPAFIMFAVLIAASGLLAPLLRRPSPVGAVVVSA